MKIRTQIALALLAGVFGAANARTISVGADGTASGYELETSIMQAVTGDTILVHPGTYENAVVYITSKSLVVRSVAGPEKTILDGGRGRMLAWIRRSGDQTVIEGFTFRNGYDSQFGAGIRIGDDSHPTVRNNIFEKCEAPWGGGIYVAPRCRPVIEGNLFVANIATGSGGAIYAQYAEPVIRNNTFVGNNSDLPGSAIGLFMASPVIEKNLIARELGDVAVYLRGDKCAPKLSCNAYFGNKGIDVSAGEGAAAPDDKDRKEGDPLFADSKTYKLTAASPYRNAGTCGAIGR
ncbi:MAG: hypothetical protein EHM19_09630 [Candidatus Latescibacterota bacterium]|nr:MAG: hypothetical protein EHM19_09630 [Candidatus Latescibacterota bacterium]